MAKIQPLRKQGGGSESEFRAQSNIEAAYGGIGKIALLDGVLLIGVTVNSTETLIEHKLGRNYRGYIVCKNDQFSDIKAIDNSDASKFITLQATVACTVSLWIF